MIRYIQNTFSLAGGKHSPTQHESKQTLILSQIFSSAYEYTTLVSYAKIVNYRHNNLGDIYKFHVSNIFV